MIDKETEKIASSTKYITPLKYISGIIREYDIRQANINMLLKSDIIDKSIYTYLQNIDKQSREVYVGKMIREDKELYKAINDGISAHKILLFDKNNINIYELIRIASDAVYINRSNPLQYTIFDNIQFVEKGIYNSFLNLNGLLFFIRYIGNNIDVDIKGLGENASIIHQNYMISLIANIICTMEKDSIKRAIQELNEFLKDYINYNVPYEYYIEFNSASLYRIKYCDYGFYNAPNNIHDLDINYNLTILRELLSILYDLFRSHNK